MFFIQMPEKIEFETWSTLLSAHIEIYEHLCIRKNSEDKYDIDFGNIFADVVMRNLFILWIKSHPDENAMELWSQLYDIIRTNYHEECIQRFWSGTVINLTKLVIKRVFGIPEDLLGKFQNYSVVKHIVTRKAKVWFFF